MLNNDLFAKIGKDLGRIQKGGGIETQWPFILSDFENTFGKDIIEHLNLIFNEFFKTHTITEAAELFKYPSKVSQYILLIHSAKHLNITDRQKLLNNLINILKILRKDYLCENGTNQLQNFDFLNYSEKTSFDNEDQLKINQLSSILYAYLEKLYPAVMRLGFEYHGPYLYNNKKYIVKEYYDLNQYFNEKLNFSFTNIKIISEIDDDIGIDFFGHIYGEGKSKVVGFYKDDNKIENINEIFIEIKEVYNIQQNLFNNFDYRDYAKNLIWGLFYSLKPLCDKVKLDWKPSSDIDLINKINEFKLTFPIEKFLEYVNKTPEEELNKKIALSFSDLFNEH